MAISRVQQYKQNIVTYVVAIGKELGFLDVTDFSVCEEGSGWFVHPITKANAIEKRAYRELEIYAPPHEPEIMYEPEVIIDPFWRAKQSGISLVQYDGVGRPIPTPTARALSDLLKYWENLAIKLGVDVLRDTKPPKIKLKRKSKSWKGMVRNPAEIETLNNESYTDACDFLNYWPDVRVKGICANILEIPLSELQHLIDDGSLYEHGNFTSDMDIIEQIMKELTKDWPDNEGFDVSYIDDGDMGRIWVKTFRVNVIPRASDSTPKVSKTMAPPKLSRKKKSWGLRNPSSLPDILTYACDRFTDKLEAKGLPHKAISVYVMNFWPFSDKLYTECINSGELGVNPNFLNLFVGTEEEYIDALYSSLITNYGEYIYSELFPEHREIFDDDQNEFSNMFFDYIENNENEKLFDELLAKFRGKDDVFHIKRKKKSWKGMVRNPDEDVGKKYIKRIMRIIGWDAKTLLKRFAVTNTDIILLHHTIYCMDVDGSYKYIIMNLIEKEAYTMMGINFETDFYGDEEILILDDAWRQEYIRQNGFPYRISGCSPVGSNLFITNSYWEWLYNKLINYTPLPPPKIKRRSKSWKGMVRNPGVIPNSDADIYVGFAAIKEIVSVLEQKFFSSRYPKDFKFIYVTDDDGEYAYYTTHDETTLDMAKIEEDAYKYIGIEVPMVSSPSSFISSKFRTSFISSKFRKEMIGIEGIQGVSPYGEIPEKTVEYWCFLRDLVTGKSKSPKIPPKIPPKISRKKKSWKGMVRNP